jgi:hypothetical protein
MPNANTTMLVDGNGNPYSSTNPLPMALASETITGDLAVSGAVTVTGDLDAGGGFRQFVGPFVRDNVAANLTDSRAGLGATAAVQLDLAMPRAGSLVGITAAFTVAPAGASLVVSVFKNGALMDAAAILTVPAGATLGHAATFAKGTSGLTFAAGDRIGIALTTDGSWTATTSDASVLAWVEC